MRSTIICQATLSLGGSGLPPALGSMLAELLPFFRSIASRIQSELGSMHPGVLPTTMVAFALSSLMLGLLFLMLAALRCGSLVAYFPTSVMKGMTGTLQTKMAARKS